jgi:hypothetical protein
VVRVGVWAYRVPWKAGDGLEFRLSDLAHTRVVLSRAHWVVTYERARTPVMLCCMGRRSVRGRVACRECRPASALRIAAAGQLAPCSAGSETSAASSTVSWGRRLHGCAGRPWPAPAGAPGGCASARSPATHTLTVRKVTGSRAYGLGWKVPRGSSGEASAVPAPRSGGRRRTGARARRRAAPSSPRSPAATPAAWTTPTGVACRRYGRPGGPAAGRPGSIMAMTVSTYSGNRFTASASTLPPARNAQLVTGSLRRRRPMPRSIRPGWAASSRANCSATTSGRVVGQHDAAGADPDALGAPASTAMRTAGWSPRRTACCGARPPSTGGYPAGPRPGPANDRRGERVATWTAPCGRERGRGRTVGPGRGSRWRQPPGPGSGGIRACTLRPCSSSRSSSSACWSARPRSSSSAGEARDRLDHGVRGRARRVVRRWPAAQPGCGDGHRAAAQRHHRLGRRAPLLVTPSGAGGAAGPHRSTR